MIIVSLFIILINFSRTSLLSTDTLRSMKKLDDLPLLTTDSTSAHMTFAKTAFDLNYKPEFRDSLHFRASFFRILNVD